MRPAEVCGCCSRPPCSSIPKSFLTVAEETFLVATMRSDQVDAVLVLLDEFGTVLNSNDDDGRSTDSQLTAVLQPGRYTVVASTYFAGESGDYTLVLDAFYRR